MLKGLGRRRCLGDHRDLSLYRTENVARGPSHCHATLVLGPPRQGRSIWVCQSCLSSHLQRGPCSCPFWTHDTGTQGLATFWDLQSCPILSPAQTSRPSSSLTHPVASHSPLQDVCGKPHLSQTSLLILLPSIGSCFLTLQLRKWQLHPSNCPGQKVWLCP